MEEQKTRGCSCSAEALEDDNIEDEESEAQNEIVKLTDPRLSINYPETPKAEEKRGREPYRRLEKMLLLKKAISSIKSQEV